MPHRFRRLAVATAGGLALVAGPGTAWVATGSDTGGTAASAAAPVARYTVAGTWTAENAAYSPIRGDYRGVIAVGPQRRGPGCFAVSGPVTFTARDAGGRRLGRIVTPGGELCLHGRPGARTHTLRADSGLGRIRGDGRFVTVATLPRLGDWPR